jgi:hypothetical protein
MILEFEKGVYDTKTYQYCYVESAYKEIHSETITDKKDIPDIDSWDIDIIVLRFREKGWKVIDRMRGLRS